jgi:hypothetical protein
MSLHKKPKFKMVSVFFVGRDSVVGIATTLRTGRSVDRIPVRARFSAAVQTGHGAHPAPYKMGTGSLPGGKAARAWS